MQIKNFSIEIQSRQLPIERRTKKSLFSIDKQIMSFSRVPYNCFIVSIIDSYLEKNKFHKDRPLLLGN